MVCTMTLEILNNQEQHTGHATFPWNNILQKQYMCSTLFHICPSSQNIHVPGNYKLRMIMDAFPRTIPGK